MRTRFCRYLQSPDANEGTLRDSNYSTERSPRTALLFEAKRNVLLPLVRLEDYRKECLPEAARKVAECSFRER